MPLANQIATVLKHIECTNKHPGRRESVITFMLSTCDGTMSATSHETAMARRAERVVAFDSAAMVIVWIVLGPADLAASLERACTVNGFVCLPVQSVVEARQAGPADYTFVVEFEADDGTTFAQGPCCGAIAAEMSPRTAFTYTVSAAEGRYLVDGLPPYQS